MVTEGCSGFPIIRIHDEYGILVVCVRTYMACEMPFATADLWISVIGGARPTSAAFICLVRSNPAPSSLNICMQPTAMSHAGIHAPVTTLRTPTIPPVALLQPRNPSSPAIFPPLSIPPLVLRHCTKSNRESRAETGRQDVPNSSQPKYCKRRAVDCPERLYPEVDPVPA